MVICDTLDRKFSHHSPLPSNTGDFSSFYLKEQKWAPNEKVIYLNDVPEFNII